MVSLCHAAFFGLAGYVLALLSPGYDPASLLLTLPAAMLAAAAAALIIGALLIGLTDTFGKVFFPSVSSILIYVLMAAVLLWRPNGILGRREV
jgi:branched-chain amino acid transport system permease protein